MGELVFVCPWPARGKKLGQVEGGGGRVPAFPFPFLGGGGRFTTCLLSPSVDTKVQPHLLVHDGRAWFELGTAVSDSLGQKGPLVRLLPPCLLIPSRAPALHPHGHSSPGRHS